MNAILGQFSLDLTSVQPAKMIVVKPYQNYVIRVLEGNYTPCPQCSSDSWFQEFKAYPSSSLGNGLQGSGFSTTRSQRKNNITNGNYEDTVFGRACWIPPTMIPFSHQPKSDVQTQRLHRLKTQATFFNNGYQKDWFGFNKGAVIASFNGTQWFAVGEIRKIRSTSNKLFIAINAPFGDLSVKNNLTVRVTTNQNNNNDIPRTDFNNKGASCQKIIFVKKILIALQSLVGNMYVQKLLLIKQVFLFLILMGQNFQIKNLHLHPFLKFLLLIHHQKKQQKKCIYKGQGSLCKVNYSSFESEEQRRLFTCAPNFLLCSYFIIIF